MQFKIADFWQSGNSNLALMLDYDGTLTPIVTDPARAEITPEHLEIIRKLSRQSNINLAIVSGRSVEQLCHFLEPVLVENIIFCGLHGGEILHPATNTVLHSGNIAESTFLMGKFLSHLLNSLIAERLLDSGIIIEDKKYSIAMHYRLLPEHLKQVAIKTFEKIYADGTDYSKFFRIQQGKELLEILPISFNKGSGVNFLINYWSQLSPAYPCYIGDDLTDESAFEAVNKQNGLSICVGKGLNDTGAKMVVSSIQSVYQLLTGIL